LPELLVKINENTMKVNNKLYFNFLLDFVKHYNHAFGDSIIPFLETIVSRVISELHLCHEKGEKNNLVINKCWNVIRTIVEYEVFINNYYNNIEGTLLPLFEFLVDPTKIEFEDDIVLVLKSFIKRKKSVSKNLWIIFPHLEKVFTKNKDSFGNLLDTVNYYLLYGKEFIAENKDYLNMILNMGKRSLFSVEPNVTI
jgi:hypothetical protein